MPNEVNMINRGIFQELCGFSVATTGLLGETLSVLTFTHSQALVWTGHTTKADQQESADRHSVLCVSSLPLLSRPRSFHTFTSCRVAGLTGCSSGTTVTPHLFVGIRLGVSDPTVASNMQTVSDATHPKPHLRSYPAGDVPSRPRLR